MERPRLDTCGDPTSEVHWSPDGHQVAYTAYGSLVVVDASSGRLRTVTRVSGPFTWWAGARLAYICRAAAGSAGFGWCAIRPDGSGEVRLPVRGRNLTWSPAAGEIAYLRDPRGGPGGGFRLQVWVANTDGTLAHRVFSEHGECCMTLVPKLVWSPDGSRLLSSGSEVNIIERATGRVNRLRWWTPVGLRSWSPSWRP